MNNPTLESRAFRSTSACLYASTDGDPMRPGGEQSSEPGAEAPVGAIGKVLVVDDNADLADLAEILLTANGLEAIVAYSAAQALDVLAAHPEVGAVITDVVMPGMNGIDLADRIAERYPKVKIILVSGFVAPAASHGQALKHMLVAKPYRIEHLIQLLQSPA